MKWIQMHPDGNAAPVLIQGLMRTGDMAAGQIVELLNADLEYGITYLDTSDIYARGRCEELLGKAFEMSPGLRDRFIL